MLWGEIAALLHDVGKFSRAFVEAGISEDEPSPTEAHTTHFQVKLQESHPVLYKILFERPIAGPALKEVQWKWLQHLGDLIWMHHPIDKNKIRQLYGNLAGLLPLYLIMIADTTDSAFSKGSRGQEKQFRSSLYLATPFGEEDHWIELDQFERQSQAFFQELEHILRDFPDYSAQDFPQIEARLRQIRRRLLRLLKDRACFSLAETRLPNNDVSLWQHSYWTAAFFKALLARYLYFGAEPYPWEPDQKGSGKEKIVYYRERLAILGICFEADEIIKKSLRPPEMAGRKLRLYQTLQRVKSLIEEEYLLGNEVYQDRNGIYFLVPQEDRLVVEKGVQAIDDILNGSEGLRGELAWEARWQPMGLNVLKLTSMIQGNYNEILPVSCQPCWVEDWQGKEGQYEVCPRCGLRPVAFSPTLSGSEIDKERACEFCQKLIKEGKTARSKQDNPAFGQLFGLTETDQHWTLDISRLKTAGNSYVALVQAILDLNPFTSGRAFCCQLAFRPEANAYQQLKQFWPVPEEISNKDLDLDKYKELLRDTKIGEEDGRVEGKDRREKVVNFIKQRVLSAPFDDCLKTDTARIFNYINRKQPAPSRLFAIWEGSREFLKNGRGICEAYGIDYVPIELDYGESMFLVPASRAWEVVKHLYFTYTERFVRVRHLLPLHLRVVVFYYKAPLYVALDAARRFKKIVLQTKKTLWQVQKVHGDGSQYTLTLKDHKGEAVTWHVPLYLPSKGGQKKTDYFYPYFLVEGEEHPRHISEIKAGQRLYIYPSSFDYEILDATIRRYDIYLQPDGTRPHPFFKSGGPRPYALSVIERWGKIWDMFEAIERHQKSILVEMLASVLNWQERATKQRLAEDLLRQCLGDKLAESGLGLKTLTDMALKGELLDLLEWQEFISKCD